MHTPKSAELVFTAVKDIGHNAPAIICTACGKKIPPVLESGWMVEIPVNADGQWLIVLCSDTCLKDFQGKGVFSAAQINGFIADRLQAMRNV